MSNHTFKYSTMHVWMGQLESKDMYWSGIIICSRETHYNYHELLFEWVFDCLTCHLPVVLLQLVDPAPLGPILLVDVDLMVVGAQGDLWP